MGVYRVKIKGETKPRAIKAASAAAARAEMCEAEAMTSDEIADFTADGGVVLGAGRPQTASTKSE